MIDIPEERILKEITDILMNDLPKVLLELEEQSEDSIRLPPFRYVGLEENLPPGTGLPYAFVEIEEGEYTEKDRIVKNRVYRVMITIKTANDEYFWQYLFGIERAIAGAQTTLRMTIIEKKRSGTMELRILLQ